MPPHLSDEWALQPNSMGMPSACCNRFGLWRPEGLPLGSKSQPDETAWLAGHVAGLAMCWAREWFLLLRDFSGALMRALLMGIVKGAGRLAAATAAPLEKGKAPVGGKEELGGEKSRPGGEKLSCRPDDGGHLILGGLDRWSGEEAGSFIEDGHTEEHSGHFFHAAKMDGMDLEDNPALCLMHQPPFGSEHDAERPSGEDMELEDAGCPGGFSQNSLGNLGMKGYFEGSPHEEFEDFENIVEGDSETNMDSPSVFQECRGSVEQDSGEFVMFEKQSVESTPDSSEDGEYLTQYGKAPENLGTSTISGGFQSPLVLSLFYSPSEEDDDDSEDWSSDSEMEETSQLYLDAAALGTGDSSSAAEDNSQQQDFRESFRGSCFLNTDPLHSLCVSKSIQPTTGALPEPKRHKEITVSFHLRKADSRPSSPEDQRSATRHPPHQCCLLETERNHGSVTTETSLDAQKESQRIKKVRFSPVVTVHTLVVWDYASRAARRGPWEEVARDRCRFQHRIAEVGAILEPCLEAGHRAKAWRKIHGTLDFVRPETANGALHRSAGREQWSF